MTHRFLHRSGRESVSFSGGQHTEGLVRPTVVVEQDTVADHAADVLLGLEPMAVDALLLEDPDQPLNQDVLLWTVRRDELLLQAITETKRCQTKRCLTYFVRPMGMPAKV